MPARLRAAASCPPRRLSRIEFAVHAVHDVFFDPQLENVFVPPDAEKPVYPTLANDLAVTHVVRTCCQFRPPGAFPCLLIQQPRLLDAIRQKPGENVGTDLGGLRCATGNLHCVSSIRPGFRVALGTSRSTSSASASKMHVWIRAFALSKRSASDHSRKAKPNTPRTNASTGAATDSIAFSRERLSWSAGSAPTGG